MRRLQPPFGHQGQWLSDDLDRINSPIAAVFALRHNERGTATGDTSAAAASDQARRFVVATELGLLDARFSPGGNGGGSLDSTLTPWTEVRGVLLTAETTLNDALRHRTRRRLTVANPAIEINEPADEGRAHRVLA